MDRQELSYKTTITFVVTVAFLCSAISGYYWYERGIMDTIPKVEVERLRANVVGLHLESQKKVSTRLRTDSTNARFTIDSLHRALTASKRKTGLTRDSLGQCRKEVLQKDATIDSALAAMGSLRKVLVATQDTMVQGRAQLAALRKGNNLLASRLNNAAVELEEIRDTIDLLLPDAAEENKLRQENHAYRFGFFLLLLTLIIVGCGIRMGWFTKRKSRRPRLDPKAPSAGEPVEMVEEFKLPPDLFKKRDDSKKTSVAAKEKLIVPEIDEVSRSSNTEQTISITSSTGEHEANTKKKYLKHNATFKVEAIRQMEQGTSVSA